MQRSTLAKRLWLLLSAVTCLTYLYGLGTYSLVGSDEPRYAQVAREMYERGDFVTPTLAGRHWFEKPPLLYWMMIGAYGALGVSEFAARLGPALSGLACVLSVGLLARSIEEKSGEAASGLGLCAAGLLASSAGVLVFSRGATFDIILTACVAISLSCFLASELEDDVRRRRLLLAGFYAGIGLATLAKGLAGVILPAGVVASYFLLRRERPRPVRLGVLWGGLLSLAVAATWYWPATARHGWQFINEFIVQHHFARYVSNKYNHPQPFYYYVYVMPLMAAPWTLFLLSGLAGARKWNLRGETAVDKLRVFALAWFLWPIIFFSFSGSKLPGYVLPALPGAALLAAEGLSRYVRGGGGGGWMRATGVLAIVLVLSGLVYVFYTGIVPARTSLVIAAPALAAGALALVRPSRRVLCAASMAGASFLTVVLTVALALVPYTRAESVRDLVRAADDQGYSQWRVYYMLTAERTAEFYAAGRLGYDDRGETLKPDGEWDVAELLKRGEGRALILVQRKFLSRLLGYPPLETKVVADNGRIAIVATQLR